MRCKYCNKTFVDNIYLLRHQKTSVKCLNIRKDSGEDINIPQFDCSCGKSYTRRDSLARHAKICVNNTINNGSSNQPISVIGDNNTVTVNNINILLPFCIDDINPEHAEAILLEKCTDEMIEKKDINGMVKIICDYIFTKDMFSCCYLPRSNMYKMVRKNGDSFRIQDDPGAKRMCVMCQNFISKRIESKDRSTKLASLNNKNIKKGLDNGLSNTMIKDDEKDLLFERLQNENDEFTKRIKQEIMDTFANSHKYFKQDQYKQDLYSCGPNGKYLFFYKKVGNELKPQISLKFIGNGNIVILDKTDTKYFEDNGLEDYVSDIKYSDAFLRYINK